MFLKTRKSWSDTLHFFSEIACFGPILVRLPFFFCWVLCALSLNYLILVLNVIFVSSFSASISVAIAVVNIIDSSKKMCFFVSYDYSLCLVDVTGKVLPN